MTEEWRAIDGYPAYEVSSEGRIRRTAAARNSPAGHVLSTRGLRSGYPSVDLCHEGKKTTHLVHRVVAVAFLGPCPDSHEVNHRDADKTNNRAENLEYVTSSQNQFHSFEHGRQDCSGENNGQAKLTVDQVRDIRKRARQGARYTVLAASFGITESNIRAIVHRRTWKDVED